MRRTIASRFPLTMTLCMVLVGTAAPFGALADVSLPAVFSDNMVLQRELPLPVWGWAKPGEPVTVSLRASSAATQAADDGSWRVTLPPMEAGGPYVLTVRGANTIIVTNVLVGEVWLCSGQSNMAWPVRASASAHEAIRTANLPQVRLFQVPRRPSLQPESDVKTRWTPCTSNTVAAFSAVGYFFGRRLHEELEVPVGLINSSWGGTRIQPWTPPEGFAAVPALSNFVSRTDSFDAQYRKAAVHFFGLLRKKMAEHLDPPEPTDDELIDAFDINGIEEEPENDGAGVFSDEMAMPEPVDPMRKHAERIQAWLPAAEKEIEDGRDLPPLPGGWPRGWPVPPGRPGRGPGTTTALYNGMIHPLKPFALRGAIWYQGEANRAEGLQYHESMLALIRGWRRAWGQRALPFYFVQIAPYRYGGDPELLPELWEAQTMTLSEPDTGMAVIADVGNVANIHPKNKKEVGRRLSLWALAKTYGRDTLVYSGPLYDSMTLEGHGIRIRFKHADGGLASRDGQPLTCFTIAGEDRAFHPAEAIIEGNTIVVSSSEVEAPVAVRSGWHQENEPNLMNREGLPASPFRTDRWPREK